MSSAPTPSHSDGHPSGMDGSMTPTAPKETDETEDKGNGDEASASAGTPHGTGAATAAKSDANDQGLIPDVSVPRRQPVSKKGLLAVVLLASSLVAVSVMAIHRFSAGRLKTGTDDQATSRDKPAAAMAEPRKLDLSGAMAFPASNSGASAAIGAAAVPTHRVPALVPTEEELAEPIGVRRTGSPAPSGPGSRTMLPEDAPVMLVTTRPVLGSAIGTAPRSTIIPTDPRGGSQHRAQLDESGTEPTDPMSATERNLQEYQRRLQGLLDRLTQASDLARGTDASALITEASGSGPATPTYGPSRYTAPPTPHGHQSQGGQLFGGQLPASATPKATAALLGNRSLTLPKGTSFTCALKSRIVTASSGMVGCMVQRNVYGDDGRVLLIERGSHLDGEYRVTTVRPGTVRIPVLWTRVRTPLGVTVDIDSPATGQLGESGIEGHVDNRWTERLGAALLLSLIDDSVQLIASNQAEQGQGGTVVLSSTTSSTSKLAEKVLDSTINIPPLIYRNQGGIVGIHVARDVDFSGVYELVPTPNGSAGR